MPPSDHHSATGTTGRAPLYFATALVVAALISFTRRWTPIGDLALVDLRLRGLWSHPPLVGPYSRLGWSHPGPAMYYLLWLPWKIGGEGAHGLLFATLLWHAGASALSLWLAARCGGRRLMLAVAASLVTTAWVSQVDAMIQPWNPFLNFTLVPALLCSFVLALRSDRVGWLWFVLVGSLMAQNHLGMLPPVLVLGGLAFVATVLHVLRQGAKSDVGRSSVATLAASAGLSLLVWLPPLVDELRHSPGNLTLLWRFATDSKDKLGFAGALHILGRMLGPKPSWLGFRPPIDDLVGGLDTKLAGLAVIPIFLAVPLAAFILALRHKRRDDLEILLAGGVLIATGFVAMIGLTGLPHEYLVAWISMACGLWVFMSLGCLIPTLPGIRATRLVPLVPVAVALCGVVLAVWTVVSPDPYRHVAPAARSLDAQLERRFGKQPVTIDFTDVADLEASEVLSAITSRAEQRGWTVFVPVDQADVGFTGSLVLPVKQRPHGRFDLSLASGLNAKKLSADARFERVAYYQPYSQQTFEKIMDLQNQVDDFEALRTFTEDQRVVNFYNRIELARLKGTTNVIGIFLRKR